MDQELLVDEQIEDGEQIIAGLVKAGFDISVAVMVIKSESLILRYYIASDNLSSNSLGDAHAKLYSVLSGLPNRLPWISYIWFVNTSHPVAQDAVALRDRKKGRMPVRLQGTRLGDVDVSDAYIYPKIGPMTREDVRLTVMALLSQRRNAAPSTFTFADGSKKRAFPIGMHLSLAGVAHPLQFDLQDPQTGQSLSVPADDVVNIQ